MVMKIIALFGFAPTDTQATRPPLLAYLLLILSAYFAANIVEWVAGILGTRWSVYLRTVGVVSTALVFHGLYRGIIHRDDWSWGGYLKKQLQ